MMIDYYEKKDLDKALLQKKKTLIFYFVTLGLFLLLSAGIVIWYLTLPYKSPTITWVKVIHFPLIAIFIAFSFLYLGIKYKRVNNYCKLMHNLETGIRETSTASFFEYSNELQYKDGVDCKALVFLEWNKYKKDFYERKVMVLYEKEFPEIQEGQNVKFVTQGNVLISYEILS